VPVTAGTPRGRQPSTIRDVAAAAGVSVATVSRVLSGVRPDDDDIAARVRAAATALAFRPNPSAQGMRRPVPAVGVVVPDLANPYFAGVLKGISAAAEAAGQRVLVADAEEQPEEEVRLVHDLIRWTTGIVLCSPRAPTRQLVALAEETDRPLVTVNRPVPGRPAVLMDFAEGIREICTHLRELGHEHVVYLGGPVQSWSDGERRRALRAEVRGGLRVDFVAGGSDIAQGHAATDAAVATGATAVIAFSDYVALGVLMRAGELGLRIPEDLSLTGFDDIPVSGIAGPGLTTTAVDKTALGRCAHELLAGAPSGRRRRMSPSLVVRGSTGSVARR
jgi:LacI family transcriptional regulator, galactose operon repressor